MSGISSLSTRTPGYIGGAILDRLLNHPNADTFEITALVRNPEKARILESQFGVKTIIASHAEHDKIQTVVEANHVIFHIVRTVHLLTPDILLNMALQG